MKQKFIIPSPTGHEFLIPLLRISSRLCVLLFCSLHVCCWSPNTRVGTTVLSRMRMCMLHFVFYEICLFRSQYFVRSCEFFSACFLSFRHFYLKIYISDAGVKFGNSARPIIVLVNVDDVYLACRSFR